MTVAELLRRMLAKAEAGDITAVAIAVTRADLSTASCWAIEDATLAEVLGAIAILNARLIGPAKQSDGW